MSVHINVYRRKLARFFSSFIKSGKQEALIKSSVFIVVVIFVSGLIIGIIESRLDPLILSYAEAEVNNTALLMMNEAVNEAVEASALTYDSICSFEKSSEGTITACKVNISQVNKIKKEIIERIIISLDELRECRILIPLGNVFDDNILYGHGPEISLRVTPVGSLSCDAENEFESAGMGRTRHRIVFKISTELLTTTAAGKNKITVDCDTVIAETVIIGTLPENYTYIELDKAE